MINIKDIFKFHRQPSPLKTDLRNTQIDRFATERDCRKT
jgi:hypothetical protein